MISSHYYNCTNCCNLVEEKSKYTTITVLRETAESFRHMGYSGQTADEVLCNLIKSAKTAKER